MFGCTTDAPPVIYNPLIFPFSNLHTRRLCKQFSPIFELCMTVLDLSETPSLITQTLEVGAAGNRQTTTS
jgi:hypothetical protein